MPLDSNAGADGKPGSGGSPSAGRVMTIISFFAACPDAAFTFAQIHRAVQMSRATCHAILTSLVEGGFLFRNPDKSFVLGPALVGLAHNIERHFSPAEMIRQEMRRLANALDLVVMAMTLEDGEVHVRERAASPRHVRWLPLPRTRYPVSPVSAVQLCARDPAHVGNCLERFGFDLEQSYVEALKRQVRLSRENGFVATSGPSSLARAEARPPKDRVVMGEVFEDLAEGEYYQVQLVMGSIYDIEGKVAMVLAAHGFEARTLGQDIRRVGEQVAQSCGLITEYVSCRPSSPPPARPSASLV